jgi:hypothetical protein
MPSGECREGERWSVPAVGQWGLCKFLHSSARGRGRNSPGLLSWGKTRAARFRNADI